MKITLRRATKGPLSFASSAICHSCPRIKQRSIHYSLPLYAVPHPITAHGPPPKAPIPASEFEAGLERRKKRSELIQPDRKTQSQLSNHTPALKKKFWKDVHVKNVDGMSGGGSPPKVLKYARFIKLTMDGLGFL
jgi:hypothetical protein